MQKIIKVSQKNTNLNYHSEKQKGYLSFFYEHMSFEEQCKGEN